jgi:RNA polymerase sigma factor (sigma-70 family)
MQTNQPGGSSPPATGDPNVQQPERTTKPAYPIVDLAKLVAGVQAGEAVALEQLYKLFSKGLRYYLCRQLGPQDLEDKVHDTFLIVVKAIQQGDLREPERLMGFVRTVSRRKVAACIEQNVLSRRKEENSVGAGSNAADSQKNPEQEAISRQRSQLMKSSLEQLSERDREILMRFYLQEQPMEQICQEMALTYTQFRLTKSRAKAKFGAIGKKKVMMTGERLSAISRGHAA